MIVLKCKDQAVAELLTVLSVAPGRVKPKEKLSFESSLTAPRALRCFPIRVLGCRGWGETASKAWCSKMWSFGWFYTLSGHVRSSSSREGNVLFFPQTSVGRSSLNLININCRNKYWVCRNRISKMCHNLERKELKTHKEYFKILLDILYLFS